MRAKIPVDSFPKTRTICEKSMSLEFTNSSRVACKKSLTFCKMIMASENTITLATVNFGFYSF